MMQSQGVMEVKRERKKKLERRGDQSVVKSRRGVYATVCLCVCVCVCVCVCLCVCVCTLTQSFCDGVDETLSFILHILLGLKRDGNETVVLSVTHIHLHT